MANQMGSAMSLHLDEEVGDVDWPTQLGIGARRSGEITALTVPTPAEAMQIEAARQWLLS